jgi:hypothetical protein
MESADPKTIVSKCFDFAHDKNNSYFNGKIITFKNEKITPIKNHSFYKTTQHVLIRKNDSFIHQPNIDANSLKPLSKNSYMIDKNNVYFQGYTLPIKKENLKKVKVWEQSQRAYISDEENIYYRDGQIQEGFDIDTFEMLDDSEFCFDKNGIYKREWNRDKRIIINRKLPFNYKDSITQSNTISTNKYLIYENQVLDLYSWHEKLYLNLTPEQFELIKKNKIKLYPNDNQVVIEKEFDFSFLCKSTNNKIYYYNKETTADASTFRRIGNLYKDSKNTYLYNREKGLFTIKGMDNSTLKVFNGFLKDKNYIYHYNKKIIKNEELEILSIFSGYRKGCSRDTQASSNYYLFKNIEGYWLVEISNRITLKYLGYKLENSLKKKLK